MAKHVVKKGDTSRIEYIFIQDSSSTTGAGLTGLVFNSAGLVAYYVRTGGAATAITLATQTVGGAYSSGGFVAVDGVNMPGLYRFDIPDAVFAINADKGIVMVRGAANMLLPPLEYQLVDYDPENAVSLGLTNLDAAVSSRASQTSVDVVDDLIDTEIADIRARLPAALVGGRMDANIGAAAANTLNASALAADAVAEIQAGLSTLDAAGVRAAVGLAAANLDTQLAAVQADTNDIQTRIPAALVGGRVDANVGALVNNTTSAGNLQRSTLGTVTGTVGAASTTSSIVTSALSPAAAAIDQFKGRIVTFDAATTTANLRGQSTDITASTAAGVLTVTPLTTAPVSGDTFVIT